MKRTDLMLATDALYREYMRIGAELERRTAEKHRPSESQRRQHFKRWQDTAARARVRGLLRVEFTCERFPDDQMELEKDIMRLDVMQLNAFMSTRERDKPRIARLVQFQQVVPIVATQRDRYREIWKLAEGSYQHEAAEMLVIGGRRIAKTHVHGVSDGSVVPP